MKKNKNLIKFVLILLLVCITAATVTAALATNLPSEWARIIVTLVNQDPDPVEPGSFVDVRFKFENRGSENAEDITVELLPEYPFSLYGDSAVEKIGSVHGRQIGDIGRIVKYRLRVDKDAVEGDNKLKLRYKIGDSAWIESDLFQINVRTHDAVLSVESVTSSGGFKPGSKSSITVSVKNMADSLLKTIKLKLYLSDVPLAPIGTTNEKTIMQLGSKEEATVKFDLITEPDAQSDVYKMPLRINYNDKLGNSYENNNTIGIIIGDTPDIAIVLEDTDIRTSGKLGEVVVKFINKGIVDIKFLNIRLKPTKEFKLISLDEIYVGNIDSDDYETAEFDLFVETTDKDKIKLPLYIEYKDANNKGYSENVNLDLELYSASEAKKLGLIKGNNKTGILIVIIIVVGGLWFYRRWRKKRNKK
jgi:hypothetical protein